MGGAGLLLQAALSAAVASNKVKAGITSNDTRAIIVPLQRSTDNPCHPGSHPSQQALDTPPQRTYPLSTLPAFGESWFEDTVSRSC